MAKKKAATPKSKQKPTSKSKSAKPSTPTSTKVAKSLVGMLKDVEAGEPLYTGDELRQQAKSQGIELQDFLNAIKKLGSQAVREDGKSFSTFSEIKTVKIKLIG